jgi:L-ascorbate metabolism protein UlaG (beta-lactamase superfamily)
MPHSLQITYIGHSTVLIEMDGIRVLTDPLLRNRVGFLCRQSASINANIYQDIDVILISHLHMDHMDLASLRQMDRTIHLIVPYGSANILSRIKFQSIEEFRVGDNGTIGSITIESTYAKHVRSRFPLGPVGDCMGYKIKGNYVIYFAGDTDLFPEMADIGDDLDVALLPVWGWGPTIRGQHLSPYRAAQALTLLNPRLAIPIHWGTMAPLGMGWLNPPFLTRPPHAFKRYASELAPKVEIRVLPPGSSTTIEGDNPDEFY